MNKRQASDVGGRAAGAKARRSLAHHLRLALYTFLIGYGVLVVGMTVAQRRFYYVPDTLSREAAEKSARLQGMLRWTNSSGGPLGWRKPAPRPPAAWTVLVLHGNAGTALGRDYLARPLAAALNAEVFVAEYPGYGDQPGAPSQEGLLAAADAAFAALPRSAPIALVSESMGTGPAAWLAGRSPDRIAALCLIVPYNNLTDVAAAQMWWLPVRWVLLDRYPADDWLKTVSKPAAFLIAGSDTVIPPRFGRRLFEGYSGPKRLWEVPGQDHNDVLMQPEAWWREVGAFWVGAKTAGRPVP